MANKKISELPSVSSVQYTPTDILPIVNYTVLSGTTSQTLLTDLKTYINSGNTVSISGGTGILTGGTYPNFTITNSSPDRIVSISGGTGIQTGGTYPNFTITNSSPDQIVSISGGTNLSITGTYPNFGVNFTGSTGTPISSYNNIGSTGTSFNWNVSGVSTNYQVTLTANTTLALTGVRNGEYGTIIVTQDAVGGRTLTLGNVNGASGTHRVANGGVGSVVLSSNPSITDILTFTYNGSTMYWTVGNDYS